MPTIELRKENRVKPDCAWLKRHEANIASQYGEDGIIEKIFETMPPAGKWCVEFGAADGKYLSNTWNLLTNHGWGGCMIEGRPDHFPTLRKRWGSGVACVSAYVEPEGQKSLDSILDSVSAPVEFDLLSVDVDGMDWHIWKSLSKHLPRVVVIEFNPTVPNDVFFVQDRNPSLNWGCSLLALIELAREKGYELVATTAINAFFVRKEMFSLFGIADNSICSMYAPPYETKIFQCYDGTILTAGCRRLLWHQSDFGPEDLQILPPEKRKY
jgi:hypothetical protein